MAFGENPLVAELKRVVTVLQKSIFKYETYVFFSFRFFVKSTTLDCFEGRKVGLRQVNVTVESYLVVE